MAAAKLSMPFILALDDAATIRISSYLALSEGRPKKRGVP